MWRTSILLLSVAGSLVLLALSTIPLGIPGEWVWPRQILPANIPDVIDRLLMPALVAGALLAFCRFVDCRILRVSKLVAAIFLLLLVLGSCTWLNAVRQAAPSPHRELRPLWVLYDKYASGYFYDAAFETNSQEDLLSNYESRIAKGDVLHEGTHPPGLFLLNWWALQATRRSEHLMQFAEWTQPAINVRMFRTVESQATMARPLSRTELSALCLVSFVSSVLSAMTVCPVYALVRLLSDSRTAWRAACLMVTVPSVAVFAPRSDIVYAFSASMILWLMVAAIVDSSVWRSIAMSAFAALAAFLSLTVSLAHIPVIVAAGAFGVLCTSGPNGHPRRRVTGIAVLMLSMFLILCALFSWITECNLLRVWQMNLSNHAGFYSQSPRSWWKWALVNPLELAISAGLPITLCSLVGFRRAAKRLWRSKEFPGSSGDAFSRLVLSLALTWVVLWLSGKNMGEAARLWCFLTPWIVITAAFGLWRDGTAAENQNPAGDRYLSRDQPQWLLLLFAQFVVCTATVGRVSGYLKL